MYARAKTHLRVYPQRLRAAAPKSPPAQRCSPQVDAGGISATRMTQIRREVAAGRYLTNEKLDIAVERLFAALANEWPLGAAVG